MNTRERKIAHEHPAPWLKGWKDDFVHSEDESVIPPATVGADGRSDKTGTPREETVPRPGLGPRKLKIHNCHDSPQWFRSAYGMEAPSERTLRPSTHSYESLGLSML